MSTEYDLQKIDDYRWLIPKSGGMLVPGLIFASENMLLHIKKDNTTLQVANVAHLPGIVKYSLAMPDIHWGYGAPIGGVAAIDAESGVIAPGVCGYDVDCGIRLLRSNLKKKDIEGKVPELTRGLYQNIPSGVGSTGRIKLKTGEVKEVLKNGARWAVERGYGTPEDLKHTEEEGCMPQANAEKVSQRALERGREQLGTLGAGNHFMEIQEVTDIYDEKVAQAFGLFPGQITVMIHCGSRGLGYQVCDDYLVVMGRAVQKYGITLPDRQLACAPFKSPEGQDYFGAMAAAANYAWANRHCIMHWTRETFMQVLGMSTRDMGLELVYDVAHNIVKLEEHKVDGESRPLLIHRKGATRAFPQGHPSVPEDYQEVGQPVLIPGTMGTESYVLVGTLQAMDETWGSTCHGAGRAMSRHEALHRERGEAVRDRLEAKGISIRAGGWKSVAEESPNAYKDVAEVVNVCHQAGISKKVARMKPLGVVKG